MALTPFEIARSKIVSQLLAVVWLSFWPPDCADHM